MCINEVVEISPGNLDSSLRFIAQHGEVREAFSEEVPKSVFKGLAGMLEEEGKDDTDRMSRNNTKCVCFGC